jgi:hypothetical protein
MIDFLTILKIGRAQIKIKDLGVMVVLLIEEGYNLISLMIKLLL